MSEQHGQPATLVVRCPATGEPLAEVACASHAAVERAAAAARLAQRDWAALGVAARLQELVRFRDVLVASTDTLVDTLVSETGKARQEALLHELFLLLDYITWLVDRASVELAPTDVELHLLKHRRSTVRYEPRALTGVIAPWNYPLLIPFTGAMAALATGSAALVKPSEHTPLTALLVERLWNDAALPKALLQVLVGSPPTAQALIAQVDQVLFTGSVANGRLVAQACAARLIPCVLELGGLAPLVVLNDADLERTAQAICFGAFTNAGQACISVERVYAQRGIYPAVAERVTQLAAQLRVGDPRRKHVDVGAITVAAQAETALAHIADAIDRGARITSGGRMLPGPGRFLPPTVLTGCDSTMRVMREESFAPIAPLMPFDSIDEGIALANDSSLGLAAYLFTSSSEVAERIAPRLDAASVLVNDVMSHYAAPEVPLTGIKESGLGSVHGADALRQLCQLRHINTPRLPALGRDPTWFPYSATSYALGRRALRSWFSSRGWLRRARELF